MNAEPSSQLHVRRRGRFKPNGITLSAAAVIKHSSERDKEKIDGGYGRRLRIDAILNPIMSMTQANSSHSNPFASPKFCSFYLSPRLAALVAM